jgi:cell wall-associated NlpC family hydrolase
LLFYEAVPFFAGKAVEALKIKKKDEKPMVIHRKAEPKVHVAGRKVNPVKAKSDVTVKKSADIRGRSGKKTENGADAKTESSLKDALSGRKSGNRGYDGRGKGSIKVRKNSLKVMAEASAKKALSEVDGGEEVKESLDLMGTAAAPLYGLQSESGRVYRRAKERKSEKDRKRKSRKNGIRTEDDKAKSMHIRRKSVEAKKNGSGRRGSGKGGSSGRKGGIRKGSFVREQMISSFLDKFQTEQEYGEGGLINSVTKQSKMAALMAVKALLSMLAPVLLTIFLIVAVAGVIVVAVLAVIYNSPLAVFFPMPDTGYDNPRTVLSEYYAEFNQKVFDLEEDGITVTFQNTEDGVPVSNFNDTLMVYMVKYGTGQAGYVMDDEGKEHLKEVFDEMNYMDDKSSTVTMQVGDSLGKVWATAYCPCAQCCGKYANGITASGKKAKPKHTIAVDAYNPIVPMGTKVIIEGVEYTVEDTGDLNHYGNDFDIYYAKHEQTSEWGRRHVEAFLAEGNTNTVEVKTQGTMVHNLTYEDYIGTGKFDGTQTALLKEMMKDENWEYVANGTGGRAVADLAVTKIGCRYDQGRRMQEGYYDCSSLVYRLYKEVGIVLPDTAAEQGQYCYTHGMIINKKDLKPGDLIFYSYEENGRFRNISHVAIYVGDGKMVHAANPGRGVVMDALRTNSVVFYARPY